MKEYPWPKVRLESVATVQTGLAKNSKEVRNSVELPYLRVANVQDGYLDLREIKTVSVNEAKVERYSLKDGDVLLTEGGDFDKLGRGTVWQAEFVPCLHQNHVFAVRPQRDALLPEFLSLLTGSSYGKAYFRGCSKQSTNLASINSTQLKRFPVLLPPLEEQRAIAEVLATWDRAIEKTEALIAVKEKRFKWLVCHEIGEKNRGWPYMRFKDLFSTVSEKNNKGAELLSVTQDRGVIPRSQLKGRVMSPVGTTASYKLIKKGDFAVSLRSFQGGIEYSDYEGKISPAYTVLRPESHVYPAYCRHFFKSFLFINKYLRAAVVGIRDGKQISIPDLLTVKIPVPSQEEQRAVAELLDYAQLEVQLLRDLLGKYKEQKQGLMKKVLGGEWRVK